MSLKSAVLFVTRMSGADRMGGGGLDRFGFGGR
jgi:hypothetical protein